MEEERFIGAKVEKPKRKSKLERVLRREIKDVADYVESLVKDPEIPMGIEVLLGLEEPFVDLNSEQQAALLKVIIEELGVNPEGPISRTYTWEGAEGQPGEGKANVSVFPTNIENLGFHMIIYSDEKVSFAFGLL